MKKAIAMLLVLATLLSLTACGKSEEAQAVDDLIAEIGEVTLESGPAIEAAEEAYDDLIDKYAEQVEFLDDLEDARKDYDKLVKKEKERIAAENKRIAELKNQANKVDYAIDDIGEVTVDSGEVIAAARAAYDAANAEVQSYVEKLKVLTTAEADYQKAIESAAAEVDRLINAIGQVTLNSKDAINAATYAYNGLNDVCKALVKNYSRIDEAAAEYVALRIANVESLINAIGEVTLQSSEAIAAAQTAYDELTTGQKDKVTNLQVLTDAQTRLEELKQQEVQKLLSAMNVENDAVRGMKFYYPKAIPRGSDYWYTNVRSFMLPYIGTNTKGGSPWLRLIFNYTGSSWIFFEKVTVAVDDERYIFYYDYFDIERDNSGGEVWEYMDDNVGTYTLDMLKDIVDSTTVIIRFEGDSHYRDITMSASDKAAIAQVLTAYEAMGGK